MIDQLISKFEFDSVINIPAKFYQRQEKISNCFSIDK